MSDDDLSAMFSDESAAPELAPEVLPEPPAPDLPSADMGDIPAQPEAAPPAAQEDRQQHVPISALLDERDKRKAAQQEAEQLRQWKLQVEASQRQLVPSFQENPEARIQMERSAMQNALWQERLNTTEAIARSQHGDEAVTEAQQAYLAAMQDNPALYADLQRHANPYSHVMSWHKQQKAVREVGGDLDAYKARIIQEYLATQAAQPSTPKPNLPPSMASAPSAGNQATAAGSLFDQMIG